MPRTLPAVAACLAALIYAAQASASSSQESILMDDPKIVYSAPENLEPTLAEIRALGVDRIRVSVFWKLLAPDPQSQTPPFGAGGGANPRNYSADKWDRYDRIVAVAQKVGLEVLFTVTAPAPYWATGDPPEPGLEDTFRPSPSEFKDFVKALATRYSGTWADEAVRQNGASLLVGPCDPVPTIPDPPAVCSPSANDPTPSNPNPPNTGPLLPRVDTWSIWNEPNIPGWLTPQSSTDPDNQGEMLPTAPHIYRELADAMYSGLQETGHGSDRILIVESAPRGASREGVTEGIRPLRFIRELYCLDDDFRHFKGRAAAVRSCPDGGIGFAAAHPILFSAAGFAHHPYAFEAPPSASDATKDHVVLADLRRLTTTLDRVLSRHGSGRRLPVWYTEYGYQTNPPDPYLGWPWSVQRRWLAEAEWIAYGQRRVRSTAQFLLYDDAPLRQYPSNHPRYWGTFQTGLRTANGERKSAYAGYQRPIHVAPARTKRGRRIAVFGLYRPATGPTGATVQFRRSGRKSWSNVTSATTNGRGFLTVGVTARHSGAFRIGFRVGDKTLNTRAAGFSLRG